MSWVSREYQGGIHRMRKFLLSLDMNAWRSFRSATLTKETIEQETDTETLKQPLVKSV